MKHTMMAALTVSIALTGCSGGGDEESDESSSESAPETTASNIAAAASGASGVSGKISFEGTPPERTVIEAEGDPKCAIMHKDSPLLSDKVLVDDNGGLANVFLIVETPPEGDYPVPESSVKLDQIGCVYTPHVLGIQVGQTLEIHNSDDTTHNVRAVARKNKPFNLGQPAGSKPREKSFKNAEDGIRLKCDIHRWMTAYVFSVEHPFFAVSDESGAFTIAGLPAGDYSIKAWHESLGEQTGSLTVGDDGAGEINFSFSE